MEKKTSRSFPPVVILFIGILAVSSASLLIRFAQSEVPSLVIAAYRLSLAALLVAPFCFKVFRKEVLPASLKTKGLLLLSGTFLALHFAFWITSLEYTSVASSVVLVTTAPLWVALLSPVFLKEKLSKWTLVGLAVSLAGSVVVGLSSNCEFSDGGFVCENFGAGFNKRFFIGDLLALAGAFLSGGYLMVGRKVREHISLSSYIFSVYSSAAILLVLFALLSGQKLFGYSGKVYIWLIALALIPQVIGHSSFNWALKYLPAAYVAIALLGEPIGTVILTMIFLKESPMLLEVIGGVLILVGIFLASRNSMIDPEVETT
jgi:drug/metabolite transporter (DMT)-like permease